MTIMVDRVDASQADLCFFFVKHEQRPVAMFQNSLSSYQEEYRSDGFALITELLSVL